MKIYRISTITKLAWKFSVEFTYKCGYCNSPLLVKDITVNPNHHFNPGQLYKCNCDKSSFWANSIRYPKALIDYCDGKEVEFHHHPETYGFCNDEYCPFCWKHIQCMKTGKLIGNKYYDIFGCDKCTNNQNMISEGHGKGERDGQEYLAKWYKNNQSMWRDKVSIL